MQVAREELCKHILYFQKHLFFSLQAFSRLIISEVFTGAFCGWTVCFTFSSVLHNSVLALTSTSFSFFSENWTNTFLKHHKP